MNTKNFPKDKMTEDQFFFETEAEIPQDVRDLMFEGRRIESHGSARSWLDDDGR